uniref:RING-type domain-containing protein n=1 Tax=Oryza punctata TaxID=4537 RepID=A0A0E0LNP5_ORYPU
MASANGGDRAATGILRLLLAMGMGPSVQMPGEGGVMLVQHIIIGDDGGDLFSGGLGGGVPPASKAAIASLKEVKAGEEEGEGGGDSLGDCAICLDAFAAGKEMPCGHRFHGECLERWLGVHGSCPVCRRELPTAEQAAAEQQSGGGADAGERRRPRAVVVSYVVLGDGGRGGEREEPWNIRIEDVD